MSDNKEGEKEKPFTVSQISKLIKTTLETSFNSVWVEGELSKVAMPMSGHIYLTLKDENSTIDANLWKGKRGILRFELEEGMKVLLRGRISTYAPYGKYNLNVDAIEPAGIGELQIRFEQLKKKLSAKGYFDNDRKKDLPPFPKRIGVVTSQTGAAFKDISQILKRRDPTIKIIIAPVMVEGEQAKTGIAEAINNFNEYGVVDLLIVGRGGGSPESLWAFNEEIVADAIFNSKIPIISAVGHEIDFTIADFVADLRASTPSAAAELAVKERDDLINTVATHVKRMQTATTTKIRELKQSLSQLRDATVLLEPTRFLEEYRLRVDENLLKIADSINRKSADAKNRMASLQKQLGILKPENLIRQKQERIRELSRRLVKGSSDILLGKKNLFVKNGSMLNALSPLTVLDRGYALATDKNGKVIKDSSSVSSGDSIAVRLSKGTIDCEVK